MQRLPIQEISTSIKKFRDDLAAKMEIFKITEKHEKMVILKKSLDRMLRDFDKLIANRPTFKTSARMRINPRLGTHKKVLSDKINITMYEQEKRMAEFRDSRLKIEREESLLYKEKALNQVTSQVRVGEARAKQQYEEEANCCTRTFCCYFMQSKKEIEDITQEKQRKERELREQEEALLREKRELEQEAKKKQALDHAETDKYLNENAELIKAEAAAEVDVERGYDAYKYTFSAEEMLLLIRLNSCVRRIGYEFEEKSSKKINQNTHLIPETLQEFKAFVKKLNESSKPICCVNPDRPRHKANFGERDGLYNKFHNLDVQSKQDILDGKISQPLLDKIFPWQVSVNSLSCYAQVANKDNTNVALYKRQSSFRK